MVNYRLRENVAAMILCLFNPSGSSVETQYTFSSLVDYVIDCACQLERGERIKRHPYHLAPCYADALRAQEDFKRNITALRKEKAAENISLLPDENTTHLLPPSGKPSQISGKEFGNHAFLRSHNRQKAD